MILFAAALMLASPSALTDGEKAQLQETAVSWSRCLGTAARRFNGSKEPAETIVTAAFGQCRPEEQKHMATLTQINGERNAAQLMDESRRDLAERLTAMIVEARTPKAAAR